MSTRTDEAAAFYKERDKRTLEYGASDSALDTPIALVVSPGVASTLAGQAAARALAELLIRVHRNVRIDAPAVRVLGDLDGPGLAEALHEIALAIDPWQDTRRSPIANEVTVELVAFSDTSPAQVSGKWIGGRGEVCVNGAAPEGVQSLVDLTPNSSDDRTSEADILGASTAACLTAAAAFAIVHGNTPKSAAVNLLEHSEGANATSGTLSGPVDVGDVQVIGAGAVGHALAYWLRELGAVGAWQFVDADQAELHNTNRCLGMTAEAAGWPEGRPSGQAVSKAASASALIAAEPIVAWHDQLRSDRNRPDLVLVLANERNVRLEVASLGEPVLLHATTSPNWTAELHRHVAGTDDCPACRIPDSHVPQFACSTGPVDATLPRGNDAALPFLSATAGLMLACALLDLQHNRSMLSGKHNHWRLDMALAAASRLWQRSINPGDRCPHTLSARVRARLHGTNPRRWDFIEEQPRPVGAAQACTQSQPGSTSGADNASEVSD